MLAILIAWLAVWSVGIVARAQSAEMGQTDPQTLGPSAGATEWTLDERLADFERRAAVANEEANAVTEQRIAVLERRVRLSREIAIAEKEKAAGKSAVSLSGRALYDFAYFTQSSVNQATYGNMLDGSGPRSIRIGAAGRTYDTISYKFELDFNGGVYDNTPGPSSALLGAGITYRDVYIGFTDLPMIGNLWVGHYREPYSLETINGPLTIMFMESTMSDFEWSPGWNWGVMAFDQDADRRTFWQAGVFQNDLPDTLPQRLSDNLACALTTRIAHLLWYDESAPDRGLLHLGASYSYRNGFGNAHNFRARPNTGFGGSAAFIINNGNPNLADYQLFGAEFAFAYGALLVESEAKAAVLNPAAGGNPEATLRAYHIQFGYLLTGENRDYDRDRGFFGRVVPHQNFFRVRDENGDIATSLGSWEIAYRFDYLDTTEAYWLNRDLAATHTVGLNWGLTPNCRMCFDWVHALPNRNGTSGGTADVTMIRVQTDF